eukprot:884822-Pelagomonas_calceolata.AAC.1
MGKLGLEAAVEEKEAGAIMVQKEKVTEGTMAMEAAVKEEVVVVTGEEEWLRVQAQIVVWR